MNRLVAFGCSNTYGHGLPDCIENGLPGRSPSKLAWPNLLATKLNLNVVNMGQPGASNKRIWHNALHYNYNHSDTVVIMWSYISRYAILDKSHEGPFESLHDKRMSPLVNLHPNQDNKRSRNYFKQFYEDYDSTQQLLAYSSHIHYMLESKNIKTYHIFAECHMYEDNFYNLLPDSMNWKHWGFHWEENRIDEADDIRHNGPLSHIQWTDKIFDWMSE